MVALVFTTTIASGLILYVTAFAGDKAISTLGVVLFGITVAINRAVGTRGPGITDVEKLDAEP